MLDISTTWFYVAYLWLLLVTKHYGNVTFGTTVSYLILDGKLCWFSWTSYHWKMEVLLLWILLQILLLDTLVSKAIPKEAQHSFSTCFEGLLIFTVFFLNLTHLPLENAFIFSDKNYISSAKVSVCFPFSIQMWAGSGLFFPRMLSRDCLMYPPKTSFFFYWYRSTTPIFRKKKKEKATLVWWFIPGGSSASHSLLVSTSVLPVAWGREFSVLIYIFTKKIDAQCSCSPPAGQCPARPQAAAALWPISHEFSKVFFCFVF